MLCEMCNKNEATIHIQEIISSQKKTLHICAECAAKKSQASGILNSLNLAEILYNISSNALGHSPSQDEIQSDGSGTPVGAPGLCVVLTCNKCGWDSLRFSQTGRLGCSECYNLFKFILSNALRNMHKGTLHVGKKPGTLRGTETSAQLLELMDMRKKLEEYVMREEYEKAAEIRDKLNAMKKKKKDNKR